MPLRECMHCAEMEARIIELEQENARLRGPETVESYAEVIREVFDYWRKTCDHPSAKLTTGRRSKVRARLKEGYTRLQLLAAVRGAARGAFTDTRGHVWDDLELICRSGSNVERFEAFDGGDATVIAGKFLGR